ncbi:MAG: sigma-70 family RNA polymerase sigma factor [Phycisphaerae bacterium]|nr:sigma-70 family RNA polymerase sigma factor [Saprospiraceae bacterium]
MKSKITDEDLLEALRGPATERERALKAFFIDDPAPLDWVKKFVLRLNGTLEDAEEVFNDAVVSLDKNVQKQAFEKRSKLMSYFFAIAKNQWYLRYKAKHPTLPLTIAEFELTETPSSDSEGKEALYELLDYGLNELEEHQRDILKAKYHEKMSMKEIAAAFELSSENIAKKYVDRFRGYLLDHVKKHPRYTQITKTDK